MTLPGWCAKIDGTRFVRKGILLGVLLLIMSLVLVAQTAEKQLTLTIDGTIQALTTDAKTVGDVLVENGLLVRSNDKLSPKTTARVINGMTIHLRRAIPVFLNTDGQLRLVYTTTDSVAELLAAEQVVLADADRVLPEAGSLVTSGLVVQVVRVSTQTVNEEIPIPFATESIKDPTQPVGRKSIQVEGENGVLLRTFAVVYANGLEESRELVEEKQLKEPVNRVVSIGTKPAPIITASRGTATGIVYEGIASWMGSNLQGQRTAYGDVYDMNAFTCAFPDKALRGKTLRVTYLKTGRSVDVVVNDWGPHVEGRLIDISAAAAKSIGLYTAGIGTVKVEVLN